jgi:hypothetical protein
VLFQFSANGLLTAVLQHLGDHCRDFAISLESRLSLEIRVEFCVVSRELLGCWFVGGRQAEQFLVEHSLLCAEAELVERFQLFGGEAAFCHAVVLLPGCRIAVVVVQHPIFYSTDNCSSSFPIIMPIPNAFLRVVSPRYNFPWLL